MMIDDDGDGGDYGRRGPDGGDYGGVMLNI